MKRLCYSLKPWVPPLELDREGEGKQLSKPSGTNTLRFIKRKRWRLRFSCVCVHIEDAAIKTLGSWGTKGERSMQFGGLRAKNAAYLAALCDVKLQFSPTTPGRGAIWKLRS